MAMDGDLRNMVMSFRVTELQTLLGYAGKNRSGRKNELQARALELVKSKSSPIVSKIKELYRSMQQSMAHQTVSATNMPGSGPFGSNNVPHNQPRLYSGSSGFSGSSDKVLQGLNAFVSYNGNQKPSQTVVTLPFCPDVKMKRLPFYDIVTELIKPTSLMPQGIGRAQDANYTFCLTPQQSADIAASKEFVAGSLGDHKLQYTMQIQLRFCSLDTTTEQDDQFPPSMTAKVNGKLIPLPHPIPSNRPGVEPKRPSRPLNVTNYVRLSPTMTNTVSVQWGSDNSRGYAMSLYLVKKLSSSDLLSRLKQKGPRPADFSRGMIKELIAKDDGDCMIAMTSLKVTIACPLGKCRMTLPCRATTCKHLQCFDANLFLQMNERKPTWLCPVCDKPTLFDNLCIDGYFQEVISKLSGSESMEVELLPDGSWQKLKPKKEKEDSSPPAKRPRVGTDTGNANQTINLDDDIVIDEDGPPIPKVEPSTAKTATTEAKKSTGPAEVIDLTLESSDEEEDVPVVRPRRKTGNPKYVIEDDSSSSSSASSATTEGSGATCPASPIAPMSPACITLDSRSPSPAEPAPSLSPRARTASTTQGTSNSNTGTSTGTGAFAEAFSSRECPVPPIQSHSSTGLRTDSRPSSSTSTFDYGHTLGQPSGFVPRSTSSHNQPVSPNLYAPGGAGYLQFDGQGMWGSNSSTNYQNPFNNPEFGVGLDFQSMDYFNYDTRGSGNSGYGRWT